MWPAGSRAMKCIRKCRVPPKRAFCAFGMLLVLVGAVVLGFAIPQVLHAKTFTQATCQIAGLQADAERTVVATGRSCERQCGFYLRASLLNGASFYVMNWMPKYQDSYSSPTGLMPEHPAFSCCPWETGNCCAYEDLSSGLFCDNFGLVRKDCPKAPWPCYFSTEDLDKVKQDRTSGGAVPGSSLRVGDSQNSHELLSDGLILVALGALSLTCMMPRIYLFPILRLWAFLTYASPSPDVFHSIAKYLPPQMRTPAMQLHVETCAAKVIQRQWRRYRAKETFREVVQIVVQERIKMLPWKLPTHEQVYGPKSRKTLPGQHLLYDTGDPSTFRRVVHARKMDAPTPGRQRIEVLITKNAAWLADLLCIDADHLGRELPPRISVPPPKAFADMYGIRAGHHLLKVGKLEWPSQTSGILVKAVRSSRRPVLLMFEVPSPNEAPIRRNPLPPSMIVPPPFWMDATRQVSKNSGPPPATSLAAMAVASAEGARGPQGFSEGSGFEAEDLEDGLLPGQLPMLQESQSSRRHRPEISHVSHSRCEDMAGTSSQSSRRAASTGGSPTGSSRRHSVGWTAGKFSPMRSRKESLVTAVSLPASPTHGAGRQLRRRPTDTHASDGEEGVGSLRQSACSTRRSGSQEGEPRFDR